MFFNSLNYFYFFLIVFFFYWFVFKKSINQQNAFILCVSYFFYAMWDWRFLFLIILSSTTDYVVGVFLDKTVSKNKRKLLLSFSFVVNIGLLFVFKYFNFFNEQFLVFMSIMGLHVNPVSINIILPVGISFYTFQTLSYTIDVYRRKITPSKSIIDFFAYVSFFPQLVAGPIERASHLLPQFQKKRSFVYNQACIGCKLIIWGLFKKAVIADNCSLIVDNIFAYDAFSAINPFWLLIGIVFFAFQIYCDFSGYSDMAIGSAKLLGFDLMINFRTPYLSRDIPEFWRRWHISLTSWFRDYLYIPLGGSHGVKALAVRNIFIIFLISGIWHGANWTFLVWGLFSATCFLPLFIQRKHRLNIDNASQGKKIPTPRELISIICTFLLICFGWVFFRSPSIAISMDYIVSFFYGLFTTGLMEYTPSTLIHFLPITLVPVFINCLISICFLMTVEWFGRDNCYVVDFELGGANNFIFYNSVVLLIVLLGKFDHNEFIYFQF